MADHFHVLDNAASTRLEVVALTDDHTLGDSDLGKLLRLDKDAIAQTQQVDLSGLATDDPFTLVIADNPTAELAKAASMEATIEAALQALPNIGVSGVTSVAESFTDVYDVTFAITLGSVPEIDTTKRATVTTTVIASGGTAGEQEFFFSNVASGSYEIYLGAAGPSDPLSLSSALGDIETEIGDLFDPDSPTVAVAGSGTQADPYVVEFDLAYPPDGQLVIGADSLTSIDVGVSLEEPSVTEIVLTVPQVGSAAGRSFPVGARVDLLQAGTCTVEVLADTGVVVERTSRNLTQEQWSVAGLIMDSLDHWVLFGELRQA